MSTRMKITKKPSRHDLLVVITQLQGMIGRASQLHGDDRNRNGFEKGQSVLEDAHQLCIEARSFDKPTDNV